MENLYPHLLGNNDNVLLTKIMYYQQKDYHLMPDLIFATGVRGNC